MDALPPTTSGPRAPRGALLGLFFLSGVAALVYEVLWLKELGLLFGATAQAAATTLAVFFLGLAAGSLAWGRRAARDPRPLRTYAALEAGIALSAALYFGLVTAYRALSPFLFPGLNDNPALVTAVKLGLSLAVLFPPAFLMGGTLPVMGQYLVRRSSDLGRTASALYALNTLGAAVGALAAGFVLPPSSASGAPTSWPCRSTSWSRGSPGGGALGRSPGPRARGRRPPRLPPIRRTARSSRSRPPSSPSWPWPRASSPSA